jgi:hypothetical protein
MRRVLQPVGRDAVDHEIDMPKRAPAHGKLAPELVDGRHARERLNRPQRVVGEAAVQPLDLTAVEARARLRGNAPVLAVRSPPTHGDVFAVGAFSREETQCDGDGGASRHVNGARHETVPGGGRAKDPRTLVHMLHPCSVRTAFVRYAVHLDDDACKRSRRKRVQDTSLNRRGGGRRRPCHCRLRAHDLERPTRPVPHLQTVWGEQFVELFAGRCRPWLDPYPHVRRDGRRREDDPQSRRLQCSQHLGE